MEFSDKIALTILYALSSFFFILFIIWRIRKNRSLGAIDYFNIFYLLVYFLVPIFFLFNTFITFEEKYSQFLEYDFRYHVLSFLCAILFIILVNVFYSIIKFKTKSRLGTSRNITTSKFLVMNTVFSVIGIVAYFMWSKVYGFPFGILQYADLLRDNVVIIDNPYTFFQPLTSFTIFAAYSWLILVLNYKKLSSKAFAGVMFCITFFFAILSALATDSRFAVIILFLVPIIFIFNRKKVSFKKVAVFGIIAMIALGQIDIITSSIRNKEYRRAEASNVFESISYEFGYTYANRINLFYNLENMDVKISEWDDLRNLLFAWVPKSLRPKDTQLLGDYNTSFYKNPSGGIPTDVVTASIYKGRFIGLLLMPLFLAFILKFFDSAFLGSVDDLTKMFFLYFCLAILLRVVAYYDLASLLFERFAFILYYCTMLLLCREKKSERVLQDE